MPTTLVQRARQVVSAEEDDFFKAETILYYLNKAQKKVVSFLVQEEQRKTIRTSEGILPGTDKSLRALDGLRRRTTLSLSGFTASGTYFIGSVNFPNDLNRELFVRYKGTPVRELTSKNLHFLDWGNLQPTQNESYYYITNNGTNKIFELYLYENPNDPLQLFYITNPTEIGMNDVSLADLPEQIENAIIYGAATMMLGQESVKDPEGNAQVIMQIYRDELQNSVY